MILVICVLFVQVVSQVAADATQRSPALFVRNAGQFATSAQFVAQFADQVVRVETDAIGLQVRDPSDAKAGVYLRLRFEGAASTCTAEGIDRADIAFSYFKGSDPSYWHSDVGAYRGVCLRGLYPGVNLTVREEAGAAKYDLNLQRAGDLDQVRVQVAGIESQHVDAQGTLHFLTGLGEVLQPDGRSWQILPDGSKRSVSSRVRRTGDREFGFEASGADPELPLVVDPALVWSTYLGGSILSSPPGDIAWGVDIADNGDVVVTGQTSGPDFPTTPGAFHQIGSSSIISDVFVSRLRGSDGSLVYSALIGGTESQDRPQGIRLHPDGRVTVAGITDSPDFPTTPLAFDRILSSAQFDGFVFRLTADGTNLEYSTLLGGSSLDRLNGLTIAASGSAIVTGETGGTLSFPTTTGAYQTTFANPNNSTTTFITRLAPDGQSLEWSTYLGEVGSSGFAVALTSNEDVVVAGHAGIPMFFPVTTGAYLSIPQPFSQTNVFLTRLSADGHQLVFSALFGGFGIEEPTGVAVDANDGIYVCGHTFSPDFPTTPGAFQTIQNNGSRDVFVMRFDSAGTGPIYSTLLGGLGDDLAQAIRVDPSGIATVTGWGSSLMTATPGAFDSVNARDIFVTRLNPSGSRRIYSTFLGGDAEELGLGLGMNHSGRIAVCGTSFGAGYPTTPGSAQPVFAAGQLNATISVLDLNPVGVTGIGTATAACRGPLQIQASEMPTTGATDFALLCSAAPPNTSGWLVLSSVAGSGTSTIGGARLWIDTHGRLLRFPVATDANGYVEAPIPSHVMTAGRHFYAQFLLAGTSACPAQQAWCATPGLEVVVQ